MFVTVMYKDGRTGMVKHDQLDGLISSNKIKKFLRSDGWVSIGVHRIRKKGKRGYKGQEKRQNK
ncbi:MAG: hypothetical protein A2Y97_08070 [Nitrospirae bacterium RBG_13_39_12]|nr:MAG: hypothetical protein A2Y97_08070 [Nitrospirae bacterium RBG_13_39_12]